MPGEMNELHHCPACGRHTRHRVSRDRKLAPMLWCQSCFHVRVETPEDRAQAEQAA